MLPTNEPAHPVERTAKQWLSDLALKNRWSSDLLALLSLSRKKSHLRASGWFTTFFRSLPIDGLGNPIPWYTYGAIRFLAERVRPEMTVFEYGSGNSTLWFSERVSCLISCEHDPVWYDVMKTKLPKSVTYVYAESSREGPYANMVATRPERFDMVVIDGRERVQCAKATVAALTSAGVVVWDNSDRPEYEEGYEFLKAHGFRRLDFWGMGPINTYEWCTSVFYRSSNVLGL